MLNTYNNNEIDHTLLINWYYIKCKFSKSAKSRLKSSELSRRYLTLHIDKLLKNKEIEENKKKEEKYFRKNFFTLKFLYFFI